MIGHGQKLSRKKQQLIAELIQQQTVREAAKAVGIGEATAFRWLKDAQFTSSYRKARQQLVEHSISRIQKASGEAIELLRTVLQDDTAPASSRVSASKIILELSIRGLEITDIIERIENLEQAVMAQ